MKPFFPCFSCLPVDLRRLAVLARPILACFIPFFFFLPQAKAQQLLKNIAADQTLAGDSYPQRWASTSSFLYFETRFPSQMWRTDGTAKGTQKLLSLDPPPKEDAYASPTGLEWKNQFFFRQWDPKTGWELYRTDGSPKGTSLFLDLFPGTKGGRANSSSPREFTLNGGSLFFFANTSKGTALFKSDGTAKGTAALYTAQGDLQHLTALGNKLLFLVLSPKYGESGLAISDGTPAGTKIFTKRFIVDAGNGTGSFVVLGQKALFTGRELFSVKGTELYVSDGSAQGTTLLKDLWPGNESSDPKGFQKVGKAVFFSAKHPKYGEELWKTDGTSQGTVLVKDIEPKTLQGLPLSSRPRNLQAFGNKLLFQAETQQHGVEPWISDGSTAGTHLLKDLRAGGSSSFPSHFLPVGTRAFFFTKTSGSLYTLYSTDGTSSGTRPVAPLGLKKEPLGGIQLVRLGTQVLFPNRDPKNGLEPWISDGTLTGTHILADLLPKQVQVQSSNPFAFESLGDKVYFAAVDPKKEGLYASDTTPGGTRLIASPTSIRKLYPSGDRLLWIHQKGFKTLMAFAKDQGKTLEVFTSKLGQLEGLYPLGNRWVFFEKIFIKGTGVWVTDGSKAGTKQLSWIPMTPGASWAAPIPFGQQLLFFGPVSPRRPPSTLSLWITDGTPGGTRVVQTLPSSVPILSVENRSSARLGKDILFTLLLTFKGNARLGLLMKTDGTPKGTQVLRTFTSPTFYQLKDMLRLGNRILFQAGTPSTGLELWTSDGTAKGTRMLVDLWPGSKSSAPFSLTRIGGKVVFSAMTPSTGRELFVSDGSAKGTKLLKDIRPGNLSGILSTVSFLHLGSRRVGFLAEDGTSGKRLWVTDGTAKGSKALSAALPAPGFNQELGREARLLRGNLFFDWDDHVHGREPWVWFPGASAREHAKGCGSHARLSASDPILGGTTQFSGTLPSQQKVAVLLLGATAPTPIKAGGQGCWLYVDIFRQLIPVPFSAAGGSWSLSIPIPNQPSLSNLLFQAQVLHPLQGGGFDLSNPVELVTGR